MLLALNPPIEKPANKTAKRLILMPLNIFSVNAMRQRISVFQLDPLRAKYRFEPAPTRFRP